MNEMMEKYVTAVSKLSCGNTTTIPRYAKVKAFKSKSGKRMFKISCLDDDAKVNYNMTPGNLTLEQVKSDIMSIYFFG